MIGIVTDSSVNLPPQVIKELGVEVVPLNVHIGSETCEETEISTSFLCKKMREGILPKTSQPAPGKFLEVFKKLADRCESILTIVITAAHSGTYNSALLARAMLPEVDIEVVDSRSIATGTGFLVEAAAEAAKQGKTKDEILALIRKLQELIHIYATVDTLHYLHMGGRVGAVKNLMASLLNIKPILTVQQGVVKVIGQTRTRSRSLERILTLSCQAMERFKEIDVAVLHADCHNEALKLKEALKERLNYRKFYLQEVTAVLAVHGGPGLIGIVSCPVISHSSLKAGRER